MLVNLINRIVAKAKEPSNTKRGWIWVTNIAVVLLFGAVTLGAVTYVQHENEQREDQLHNLERFRCEQQADSRDLLRGVLVGLAIRLGSDDETLTVITDFIDTEYPAIDKTECVVNPTEQ